jgi:hypothetical protein
MPHLEAGAATTTVRSAAAAAKEEAGEGGLTAGGLVSFESPTRG